MTVLLNGVSQFGPLTDAEPVYTGQILTFFQDDSATGFREQGAGFVDQITISDVALGSTNAVPEPSTWAMMILGFVDLGFIAYRRRNEPTLTAA